MHRYIVFILFFFLFKITSAQEKFTLSGYIKDSSTGENLIGSNVYNKANLAEGTTTNSYGFFSLTLKKGQYSIMISYIGYVPKEIPVTLEKNQRLTISIEPRVIQAKEVVIEADRPDKNVEDSQMGVTEMNIETVKSLPVLLGEVDILKTIQLLPGVQSSGEGNVGLYVRGGGPDQNLILLDEATVYNASHLFGFFSVFNSDAIKNIKLIKGGLPANYGGRLSSVLDITMKDGNNQTFGAEGGIGLIASRLTLQGPIIKDKSSFIVSGRRTYIDVLAKPFIPKDSPISGSRYYFYDLNAKLNYTLTDRDRLFLSGYFGRDVFNFSNAESGFSVNIPWGNSTGVLRWNHLFTDKLFMNTSLIYSDYNFELGAGQEDFDFKLFSGVRDYNVKADLSYFPNSKHEINYGVHYVYHIFTPSSASARSGGVEFDTGDIVRFHAHESAVFVNDDFKLSEKIKLNAGLRYSWFAHVGPFSRYIKNENGYISDTTKFSSGEMIKNYSGIEPRFSARYSFNKKSSFKASFTQNYQYLHLASIATVSLPTDIWVPSTSIVKPQLGRQYSAGYFRNFKDNMFETSVEVYYKSMDNLVEYKEGFEPGNNVSDNPDNNFTFGSGESYGIEFFINKQIGKTYGWIGYTLSWTDRQFADLNNGKKFFARYDRRHDVSVILSQMLGERWTLSAVFVYGSGSAFTLPVRRYFIEQNVVNEYGERNSFRLPSYHRADIAATLLPKKFKKFESSWTFSVYNVYNRLNAFFIYFENTGNIEEGNLDIRAKKVSIFPVLPSITWNFKF